MCCAMLVAAIWNLVFLLDAPAMPNRYLLTGTRVAAINALAQLSDVFCRSDSTLTRQAFAKLLSIPAMVVRTIHHVVIVQLALTRLDLLTGQR